MAKEREEKYDLPRDKHWVPSFPALHKKNFVKFIHEVVGMVV